jgi:aerotaxis receptor
MEDMHPEDIVGDFERLRLRYFDGSERTVLVTERETPYPEGRLIVSRTDLDGVLTHANQSFVAMSGYAETTLIGAPHCILRHPDMPRAAFAELWSTIRSDQAWQGYVKNLRRDGGYYWVLATVIPNVRDGEIVGYTSVRRKPSRAQIERHAARYREMLADERQ